MRPDDGSLPGRRMAQEGLARVRQAVLAAPLPVKILLVSALVLFVVLSFSLGARVWDVVVLVVLGYGPYALWRGQTSVVASVLVGIWGVVAILAVAARHQPRRGRDRAAAPAARRGGGRRACPGAVPALRAVPDRGPGHGLGPAAGPADLVARPAPPGHQLRRHLAARAQRAGLAAGQVPAGGPGAQPAAGPRQRAGRAPAARRRPAAGRPRGRRSRPAAVARRPSHPGCCRPRKARCARPRSRPPATGRPVRQRRRRSPSPRPRPNWRT